MLKAKTVYSIGLTRNEAKDRAKSRLSDGAYERRLARVKSILSRHGVIFDQHFRVDRVSSQSPEVAASAEIEEACLDFAEVGKEIYPPPARYSSIGVEASDTRGLARSIESALTIERPVHRRILHWAEAYAAGFPSQVVAGGRHNDDLADQLRPASGPLPLAGPDNAHSVDELIARVHARAPWLADATTAVWRAIKARVAAGEGFGFHPILLAGAPGTGKTTLARLIASEAEVPFVELDAGSGQSAQRLAGVESGWANRQLGEVVRAVVSGRRANPIMILNEVDKIGWVESTAGVRSSMNDSLLPLLERTSAQHFRCPASSVEMDLSSVSWILTANDAEKINPILRSRMQVVEVGPLRADGAVAFLDSKYTHCDPELLAAVKSRLVSSWSEGLTLRHIDRLMSEVSGSYGDPLLH